MKALQKFITLPLVISLLDIFVYLQLILMLLERTTYFSWSFQFEQAINLIIIFNKY